MIFVTVGTHEQPFNRLIEYIDNMKRDLKIQEEVIMQTGFCTYVPKHCTYSNFISYDEMEQYVSKARIVITHGGPASFIMPIRIGKVPIVVPRQHKFHEHVNDHQIDFVKNVAERMGTIIPVIDINELEQAISDYNLIVTRMCNKSSSNNIKFNEEFEDIVQMLF